jgi:hypothetical protein
VKIFEFKIILEQQWPPPQQHLPLSQVCLLNPICFTPSIDLLAAAAAAAVVAVVVWTELNSRFLNPNLPPRL